MASYATVHAITATTTADGYSKSVASAALSASALRILTIYDQPNSLFTTAVVQLKQWRRGILQPVIRVDD